MYLRGVKGVKELIKLLISIPKSTDGHPSQRRPVSDTLTIGGAWFMLRRA